MIYLKYKEIYIASDQKKNSSGEALCLTCRNRTTLSKTRLSLTPTCIAKQLDTSHNFKPISSLYLSINIDFYATIHFKTVIRRNICTLYLLTYHRLD